MSVVGLDVGNDTSCVALARKRGIDVLMNKESKRETPAVVNFGDKMRFLGTDGAAKMGLAPQNTVHQLKRILGKKFSDPDVQADIKKLLYSVTEASDGGCLVNVQYAGERQSFSPEQILAMIIVDLKRSVAEKEGGVVVTDCALSVPTFFTEAQRLAVLNAAQIAGVNCLQLINENTATALAYGIYKSDLPEAEPVHVVFVDVGFSATQVSVVALKKSGLVVLSHSWDQNLGGRDFDEALYDHFCAEFKEKFRVDIKTNKKAAFKLRVACEKVKKILSANTEAPLNIECIMDDVDVKGSMNRETFEKLIAPVIARLRRPIEEAMVSAKLRIDDISSVEVVGSSTRVPAVFKQVEDFFRRVPSRTMNSKECVSRGAALRCAMLSPIFKVRDFDVVDAAPYGIDFKYTTDEGVKTTALVDRNGHVPTNKLLTLHRKEPFTLSLYYAEDAAVLPSERKIGEYRVGPFVVPQSVEKAKLKSKLQINLNCISSVDSVNSIEEVEEVVPPVESPAPAPAAGAAAPDTKMEEAPEATVNGDAPSATAAEAEAGAAAASGTAPMETDPKPSAPAFTPTKKIKVVKHKVHVTATQTLGYSAKQLEDYFEKELQMQSSDKLQEETNERKNALEAYVYDLRNKLADVLAPYVTDAQRSRLGDELQKTEDWLYEEGEDERKSVYIAKLDELKALGSPVETRAVEDQTRGPLAAQLRSSAELYLATAQSDSGQYAHIDAADKATVSREAEAALAWLNEKLALQGQLSKSDDPILLTSDIVKKRDTLDRVAKPILSKPPPKAEPKVEEPPAAAGEPTAEPMEADPGAGSEAPPPLVEEMDV